jgi:hypothetical protein
MTVQYDCRRVDMTEKKIEYVAWGGKHSSRDLQAAMAKHAEKVGGIDRLWWDTDEPNKYEPGKFVQECEDYDVYMARTERKTGHVSGQVGHGGTKVHNLYVEYIELEVEDYRGVRPVRVITHCHSGCGSQRWSNYGGYSHLFITPGEEVTCKKCLNRMDPKPGTESEELTDPEPEMDYAEREQDIFEQGFDEACDMSNSPEEIFERNHSEVHGSVEIFPHDALNPEFGYLVKILDRYGNVVIKADVPTFADAVQTVVVNMTPPTPPAPEPEPTHHEKMEETPIMERTNLDGSSAVYLGRMIPMVRNQALRYCQVTKVTEKFVDFEYTNERTDKDIHFRARYDELATLLPQSFINRIVRDRTGFDTMPEMVDAPAYRPTIRPRDAWDRMMIARYGMIQFARGDSRTTYSGDEFPNRGENEPLPIGRWDGEVPADVMDRWMAEQEVKAENAAYAAQAKAEAEYYEGRAERYTSRELYPEPPGV